MSSTATLATVTLKDIRIGKHADFDRVVCELSAFAQVDIQQASLTQTEIVFSSVQLAQSFKKNPLPKTLAAISALDVIPTENSVKVFLKTRSAVTFQQTILPEPRWRLILDFMPLNPPSDAAQPSHDTKPEYIPGDRPIETRLSETVPADTVETHSQDSTTVTDFDRAHAWSVMAYYYNSIDDTHSAGLFRELYESETGKQLSFAEPSKKQASANDKATPRSAEQKGSIPPMWIILSVFVFGSAIGFGASKLPYNKLFHKSDRPRKVQTSNSGKDANSIKKDLKKLDNAVKQEKSATAMAGESATRSEVVAAEEAFAQSETEKSDVVVPSEEEEIKESMMDRRVRRVIELKNSGNDIAFIAKELEMGQDEVKLILDLNQ